MGIFSFLLKGLSEDKLCKKESKMRHKLDSMNYNSRRHTRLDLRRIDVVNEISSRRAGKLPKRKHGWYLPNDD